MILIPSFCLLLLINIDLSKNIVCTRAQHSKVTDVVFTSQKIKHTRATYIIHFTFYLLQGYDLPPPQIQFISWQNMLAAKQLCQPVARYSRKPSLLSSAPEVTEPIWSHTVPDNSFNANDALSSMLYDLRGSDCCWVLTQPAQTHRACLCCLLLQTAFYLAAFSLLISGLRESQLRASALCF